MGNPNFNGATALVASDDFLFRRRVVLALGGVWFGDVHDFATLLDVDRAMAVVSYDLIVVGARLGGELTSALFARVRDGLHTHHPFPVIVSLVDSSDKDLLADVINAGPDGLLLSPIDPPALLARVIQLAQPRKPFIVTSDYVGPDRRRDIRPGDTAPEIAAPSALVARIDKVPASKIEGQIQESRRELNAIKVERALHELGWLNKAVAKLIAEPSSDPEKLDGYLRRLVQIAECLPPRFQGSASESKVGMAVDVFLQGVEGLRTQSVDAKRLTALLGALLTSILATVERARQEMKDEHDAEATSAESPEA